MISSLTYCCVIISTAVNNYIKPHFLNINLFIIIFQFDVCCSFVPYFHYFLTEELYFFFFYIFEVLGNLGSESGRPEVCGPNPIHQLQRHQQTTLFRLRVGHILRLLSHLHRLKISHMNACPLCGMEHRPQSLCPKSARCSTNLRSQIWPWKMDMKKNLWGRRDNLERTVDFTLSSRFLI